MSQPQDLMMTPDVAKNVREHLKAECEKHDLPVSPDEKASYELFGDLAFNEDP